MKILFSTIILAILIIDATLAQQNAVVAIATKPLSCSDNVYNTDLGYQYLYGSESVKTLDIKARKKAKEANSGYNHIITKNNISMGAETNYLVIGLAETPTQKVVNGRISYSHICKRSVYGFGFGIDRDDAIRNAKNEMKKRNDIWNENYHGFNIIEDKQLKKQE